MLPFVGPALPLASFAQLVPASLSRPSLGVRIIFEWKVSFQVRYSAWWHFWQASEPTNPSAVGPPGPVTQPAVTAPSAATAATAIQPSVVFVIESNPPWTRKASLARRLMLRGYPPSDHPSFDGSSAR